MNQISLSSYKYHPKNTLSVLSLKILVSEKEGVLINAFVFVFFFVLQTLVSSCSIFFVWISENERVHLHPHRSGWYSGRKCLLGALLPWTRHPGPLISALPWIFCLDLLIFVCFLRVHATEGNIFRSGWNVLRFGSNFFRSGLSIYGSG